MGTKLQEKRKERAEAKAARLAGEANARFETARSSIEHIPPGQPILCGHHAEELFGYEPTNGGS